MPFTFKKNKRTFMSDSKTTDIKIKKQKVGYIKQENNSKWRVRLMVKKQSTIKEPAPFKWVLLTAKFENEDEARKRLNDSFDRINSLFDIYLPN